MFNRLFIKILVPVVTLMLVLSASLYFVVLRTVNDFAQQNIETDLENLVHNLFDVVDNAFMDAIKSGKAEDQLTLQVSQVECIDVLERNTYSGNFKLIVVEKQNGKILLASDLPDQIKSNEIIHDFLENSDDSLLKMAGEEFHVRHFYFSPWDWDFFVLKNTQTYASLSHKVHHVYQASAIVLLVATLSFVYLLIRGIKNPISSIVSSVSQGKTPSYKGIYEYEYLSQSIGKMMTSLRNEVAERKRAEKASEKANKAKSEFLANMSHELRTPLNAILGFTQIMERDPEKSADGESLRIIQRSGNHLMTLINQILDLSKIEAGHIELETNCFDLFHLLNELENMLSLKASKKDIRLSFEISNDVPQYICSDEVKIRQVLINLLNNAIKFTKKGSVSLRISSHGEGSFYIEYINTQSYSFPYISNMLLFEVEDTGVGIAQEEIESLFEAFSQTASGREISEGTGLGLTISNKIVELLGGEMHLESKLGQGTTFLFNIPVRVVNEFDVRPELTTSSVVGLTQGHPVYRMLIVDDNWDNRQLLVKLLEPFGFELREASNGQEALYIMDVWEPHLIWMDMRMPVMDGYEAAKRIRAVDFKGGQPVIIAVTASVFSEKRNAVFESGCDDMVIKPFTENDIYAMLQKHLKVKFVHGMGTKPFNTSDLGREELNLSPSDLNKLPEELFFQLKESVSALKIDIALEAIELIREQDEPLANKLKKLVEEYRFDILQGLLEKN